MAQRAERETKRTIYRMMRQGIKTTEIGEMLGMPQSSVSRLAQKKHMNVALRMMELADEGMTMEEIGKSFGVSKQRVYQLIGPTPKRGSRGQEVTVDAAPEAWAALMEAMSAADIHVKQRRGIDTRAITVLLDGIQSGEYAIVRRGTSGG